MESVMTDVPSATKLTESLMGAVTLCCYVEVERGEMRPATEDDVLDMLVEVDDVFKLARTLGIWKDGAGDEPKNE